MAKSKPSTPAPTPPRAWLCPVLLAFAVAMLYAPTLRFGFLPFWDDNINVHANPLFHPLSEASWRQIWTEPYASLFIPMSYSVWALLALLSRSLHGVSLQTGPLDPRVFHAANVLLHIVATLLVYRILRLCLATAGKARATAGPGCAADHGPTAPTSWAAFAGALIFACHPIQVECVAWVSGLRDLLSGTLGFASLWLYLRWGLASSGRAPFLSLTWWLGLAAFLLALGAKPAAATIPLAALLLGRGCLGLTWRRLGVSLWLWLATAAGSTTVTKLWSQTVSGTEAAWSPLWARPLIATDALAFYLGKLAWPWPLVMDYGRTPALALARGWVFWTWLFPAALVLAVATVPRLRRYALPSALFALLLLPVLGFIPFNFQSVSTVADRYLYTALLAPALAVAVLIHTSTSVPSAPLRGNSPSHLAVPFLVVACIALLAALTHRQLPVWSSGEALCLHALRHNPTSWKAHHCYGSTLAERGALNAARVQYQEAIRISPQRPEVLNDLALALSGLDRNAEAEPLLKQSLALKFNPDTALNLAHVRLRLGDRAGAIAAYRFALQLAPAHFAALKELAWQLATDLDANLRNAVDALAMAERMMAVPGATDPERLLVWAAALAENGRFAEATVAAEEAHQALLAAGRSQTAESIRTSVLPALQRQQPLRSPARAPAP